MEEEIEKDFRLNFLTSEEIYHSDNCIYAFCDQCDSIDRRIKDYKEETYINSIKAEERKRIVEGLVLIEGIDAVLLEKIKDLVYEKQEVLAVL